MNIININIKNDIKNIEDELLKDIEKTKHLRDYSFLVETKFKDNLYNIFLKICQKKLNKFTLKDSNFKLHAYYTDKYWCKGGRIIENDNLSFNRFHNHIKTSTINSVLYLKSPKGCGLDIEYDNKVKFIEADSYDFLIFPNWLNHRPVISNKESRISLNLELSCNENVNDIFNPL